MSLPSDHKAALPEYEDMQGLLRFGFKHLPHACFLLLQVRDAAAARHWLASAPVTSAITADPLPDTALQIALTSEGLRALEVDQQVIVGFANEYVEGMGADPGRSRRLGDVAASAPAQWTWGTSERVPHVLVMLYAKAGHIDEYRHSILADCVAGFDLLTSLDSAELDAFEPFGFKDGLSQPAPDWRRQRPLRDEVRHAYDNLVCLGEFVLGYPDEYGGYTDRPLLDPSDDAGSASLPRAEDAPEKADLGRNGSYLVMRQLQQNVGSFWRYLDQQAGGDPARREQLGAAMVGRTLAGEPLAEVAGPGDTDGNASNAFTYAADPQGVRCPLGAHIRRCNPRNADLPPGGSGFISRLVRTLGFDAKALENDHVASTRFHRLLRRGRKYGPQQSPAEALTTPSSYDTGLHFICLGANIARQFEFVQGAWLAGTKFDGLAGEGDPLLGHRQPGPDGTRTDVFSIPQADGPDCRLSGLPAFVTVKGGAYFFLPGLRALRYLATTS